MRVRCIVLIKPNQLTCMGPLDDDDDDDGMPMLLIDADNPPNPPPPPNPPEAINDPPVRKNEARPAYPFSVPPRLSPLPSPLPLPLLLIPPCPSPGLPVDLAALLCATNRSTPESLVVVRNERNASGKTRNTTDSLMRSPSHNMVRSKRADSRMRLKEGEKE